MRARITGMLLFDPITIRVATNAAARLAENWTKREHDSASCAVVAVRAPTVMTWHVRARPETRSNWPLAMSGPQSRTLSAVSSRDSASEG
jgi:hypothetical protein